ncbi:protein kinase domain-containing protein [Arenicella xantha]|uniref:Protein kinase-like protein n=1 Tax=Arenicella xantha TaxID=644221 RepID=A0A395JT65_9GAMM|nr:protein kinase [Arenicella xantha]RBP53532.1 protein kinase-like protein [Arenicella xantha]
MKSNSRKELKGVTLNERFQVTDDRLGKYDYNGYFGDGKFGIDLKTGEEVFIKTIVFGTQRRRFEGETATQQIERETHAFNHERRLLEVCLKHNLKRIAKLVDVGEVSDDNGDLEYAYMAFEKAESNGHIKNVTEVQDSFGFRLQLMKDVCVGLSQLHQRSIAHQDIKPSNILKTKEKGEDRGKITDLGRASIEGDGIAHDLADWAGQGMYAAPDRLYRVQTSNWNLKRTSSDLYLFGSLMWQYLSESDIPLTREWMKRLTEPLKPGNFSDTYDQVLPHLVIVFEEIFSDAINDCESEIERELITIIKELTNPDPAQRGSKSFSTRIDRHSLHPFISRLDRLLKTHLAQSRTSNA